MEATAAESASSADLSTKRSEHAAAQSTVEKLQGDKTAIESASAYMLATDVSCVCLMFLNDLKEFEASSVIQNTIRLDLD